MGKDKTAISVCISEQLSRNKTAVSCCAQSASKLQVMSPVAPSGDELVRRSHSDQRLQNVAAAAVLNSTQLNSTDNYGRRCLTPLSPHRNYILS